MLMNFATFAVSFFFTFRHSRAPERSCKIFCGGQVLEKSWIFLSVKEWEFCNDVCALCTRASFSVQFYTKVQF